MFLYGCNFWHIDMFSILINAKCSNESQPIFLRCLSCCGVVSVIEYHYKSVNKLSSDPDPECSTKTKLDSLSIIYQLTCSAIILSILLNSAMMLMSLYTPPPAILASHHVSWTRDGHVSKSRLSQNYWSSPIFYITDLNWLNHVVRLFCFN